MPIETRSDHRIEPVKGSASRLLDGEPADLLDPFGYPVEATCLTCGQPCRTDRYFYADWYHVDRLTLGGDTTREEK